VVNLLGVDAALLLDIACCINNTTRTFFSPQERGMTPFALIIGWTVDITSQTNHSFPLLWLISSLPSRSFQKFTEILDVGFGA